MLDWLRRLSRRADDERADVAHRMRLARADRAIADAKTVNMDARRAISGDAAIAAQMRQTERSIRGGKL